MSRSAAFGFQDHRAGLEYVRLQRRPGLEHGFPRFPPRARPRCRRRKGTLSPLSPVSTFHAAHLDSERGRGDLRHDRLRSLPLLGDAGAATMAPLASSLMVSRPGGDPRAAHAVEHGLGLVTSMMKEPDAW